MVSFMENQGGQWKIRTQHGWWYLGVPTWLWKPPHRCGKSTILVLADTSSINGAMVSTFGFNIYVLYINIFIYIGPVVYVTVNTLKRAR